MKIILDLKHSINNFTWENEEELKEYIGKYMIPTLWGLYRELLDESGGIVDDELTRFYDILDMFTNYTIEKE